MDAAPVDVSAPSVVDASPLVADTSFDDDILGHGTLSPALAARLAREANAIPKGKLVLSPPADEERDVAIRARFGSECSLERTCGPLWGIDCHAATDGPYYYVRPTDRALVELTVCGGACMGGRCTNCPPKNEGWTCKTY